MIAFYALVISFFIFEGLGMIGIAHFQDWQHSLQAAIAVMLLLGASAHWGSKRSEMIRMVPPAFPRPDWIVTLTGILEIIGAIGILFDATSRVASVCLAVLLIAMFPANVFAAQKKLTLGGKPVTGLLMRTIIQVIFIVAVLLAG